MPTILETHRDDGGNRRCDSVCHRAKPGGKCTCICGGRFHGIGDEAAAAVTTEDLDAARQRIDLGEHEYVQLRIGA